MPIPKLFVMNFFQQRSLKNLKLIEEDLPDQGESTREQLPNSNCLNQD